MVLQGCLILGAEVALFTGPGGAAVLAACEATFASAAALCSIPNAFPDGAELGLCALIANSVEFPPSVSLNASVFASKNGVSASDSRFFSSNSASETFNLDLPLPTCTIESFDTSPSDPNPGESYLATAVTTCSGSTDQIEISVQGSDGYNDINSCSGQRTCSLAVPGAELGVVDTVTVTTSSGESRIAVLIF